MLKSEKDKNKVKNYINFKNWFLTLKLFNIYKFF